MEKLSKNTELYIVNAAIAINFLIAVLDFLGILDSFPWLSERIPVITLLTLSLILAYLFIERRNRFDKLEELIVERNKKASLETKQIIESLHGVSVSFFDCTDPEENRSFYDALSESIENAEQEVFRSGRGFSENHQRSYIDKLINATRQALAKDVTIIRIQTMDDTLDEWAQAYARLKDEYPEKLKVFSDFFDSPLVNVGLIDPRGKNPVVQLLFETDEPHCDRMDATTLLRNLE